MSGVRYRRRGTAIVETERGILLTAGRLGKPFILPGGGVVYSLLILALIMSVIGFFLVYFISAVIPPKYTGIYDW
ncbi:hypothetical protein ACFLVE_04590 [Chloroflexota bacterium]